MTSRHSWKPPQSLLAVRFLFGLAIAIPAAFGPTHGGSALGFTAFSAVGASVVYAALDRYTGQPRRWFLVAIVVVFVALLVPALGDGPGVPGNDAVAARGDRRLHFAAAFAIAIPLLSRRGLADDVAE